MSRRKHQDLSMCYYFQMLGPLHLLFLYTKWPETQSSNKNQCYLLQTNIITVHHQSFKRLVAHRASTICLHSCRSFASREACPQVRFRAWSSASAVLLQLDFGRPLFLLPSGVHLRATLEMLVVSLRSTWPTQLHRFRVRTILMSSCSVLLRLLPWRGGMACEA